MEITGLQFVLSEPSPMLILTKEYFSKKCKAAMRANLKVIHGRMTGAGYKSTSDDWRTTAPGTFFVREYIPATDSSKWPIRIMIDVVSKHDLESKHPLYEFYGIRCGREIIARSIYDPYIDDYLTSKIESAHHPS